MKKTLGLLLFVLMFLGCVSTAGNINVQDVQQAQDLTCDPSHSINRYYYLGNNGVTVQPADYMSSNADLLIGKSDNGSLVQIWRNGVISSSYCNSWNRVSLVSPASYSIGAMVFLSEDYCKLNIPVNRTKVDNPTAIDAKIHYIVGYRVINNQYSSSLTSRLYYKHNFNGDWLCYPNGNSVQNSSQCNQITVKYGSQKIHTGECINYRVFWCGDGLVNSMTGTTYNNGTYAEQCDPNDPNEVNWGNGGCDPVTCQPVTLPNPQCNSQYNGQTQYTNDSTPWLNQWMSPSLCTIGTVTNFQYSGSPRQFTWSCENGGNTVSCSANQQWCGDGQVNGGEQCDPNDPNETNWGNGGCNQSCQPVTLPNPRCNSQYNGQVYYTLLFGSQWLHSTDNLCTVGTVTNFQPVFVPTPPLPSPIHYTWSCVVAGGNTVSCSADQQWCGDGQLQTNHGEQCDPNDPNHVGWGNGGCDNKCKKITIQNPQCNSTYNGQTQYTNDSTPWLSQSMTPPLCTAGTVTNFQYSGTPRVFTWSCDNGLTTTDCSANQQWCGDGQIQTNHGEQCDPNDPNEVNWGNGGCDPVTCQPTTIVTPQCNSQYNGSGYYSPSYIGSWLNSSMSILCTDGAVTDFQPNPIPQNPTSPIQYSWSCTTGGITTSGCNAIQMRCGDGIQQTQYGEYCDEGELNGQPGHCNTACKGPVPENPLCNSQYNGQVIYTGGSNPWLNQWMNLCTTGLVTNFQYSGTPIAYTWNCTVTGGNSTGCSAVQQWCGDGQLQTNYGEQCDPNDPYHQGWGSEGCSEVCIPITTPPSATGHLVIDKTLVGSGMISNTGDTVVWKIRVTAVSGDVTDFTIKDILPSILGYTDYSVLSNSLGLNISQNPTITQTTNGWEIKWDVIGTLTEGNYIEIQINTYATQMPNPLLTYKNVGCVIHENTETCDPEPIPGHLEILKELVGSGLISNTGDIVTWRIRVTAIGESFSGFKIIDKLPSILSYYSYTVIHNGGLTISNPVLSGNEVIWTPSGTLSTGDYVEIELQTRANGMPEGGYVNVACVSGDWIGEICNSVHIGSVKIEKTLVGNRIITNTGDAITWNIVVTALSGDVTNPIITDLLPSILSYSGYSVIISGGLSVSSPIISGNEIIWNTQGILTEGNQIVIRLITSVEEMPDHDYDNVACVKYDENGEPVICDDEPVPAPDLRIKKTFTDGSTGKVVHIGDEIAYRITFGNSGNASATITSIKDFLPKNVDYTGSEIVINRVSSHSNVGSGSETINISNTNITVDGVYIDIYTGMTLEPGDEGYIILTGIVSSNFTGNRTNFACIYLNNNPVECDSVSHDLTDLGVMCVNPIIEPASLPNGGGNVNVTCKTSPTGENANSILLDCGNGIVLSGTNISELTGICQYPANTDSVVKNYTVKCTVNGTGDCQGTVTVDRTGGPSCFPAGTKVIMADGTSKNIEDVEKGEYVLSYNTQTNANEKNIVTQRIVHKDNIHEMYELTINGNVLKVTNVHPFYVRKSESSKDYAWIEAQNLKVGDMLLMSDGKLVKIEKINHYTNQETVYNLEVSGNHDYFVDEGYLVHNKGGSTCFIAGTKVTMADGTQKNIEDVKIGEKILGSNRTVNTVVGYDRPVLGNRHLWSINGSEYFVSDEHPFMTTDGWKSFNPEMTKLEIDLNTTELKLGDILITDKGLEEVKSVDYIDADYDTPLYNFALDGDHTYYANGYLVHNKCNINEDPCCNGGCNPTPTPYCQSHKDDPICQLANPRCHNVNEGNFSIESGEYLPFYFNVRKDSSTTSYKYIFADDNSVCESGTVDLGSLKCSYIIRSPKNNKIVYSKNGTNCLEKTKERDARNSSPNLIRNWIEEQKRLYEIDIDDLSGHYLPHIEYTNSKNWDTQGILGEYKFQIEVREYKQCNENGEWEVHNISETDAAVCQSNFVLTEPYTVQKTPSGNLTASTDTLEHFKEVDGTTVKPFSSYLNAISTSEYTPNSKVRDAMGVFIEKYEKLAVNVQKGNSTIKKVPGKNIYFLNGDFPVNNSSFDKPFTLVQLNPSGKIKIEGNVTNLNMMVLTKGDIEFQGDCRQNQTVKGIFYTEGRLIRSGVKKNNDLDNDVRCTKGGLNIKGVLIGSNFNNLMNDSRSHLETWFNETPSKETKVMNGASVLIEYSPSVFTTATMPPGAEDFVTALNIYKN